MTLRILVRPKAVADLEDIWRFSKSEWGARQADLYLESLRSAFARLADTPGSGAVFEHVRANYQRLLIGSHAIFYRVSSRQIDIVRVLHQRRNASRILR
ncbi:type II toxin-antitoxin system RelE/ParE family toxin [Bosea sp. PAMC 26642]|uniref:type II toxin-antitoxin system RelE/ParE family toxin n=1 Tax=Bosea sp. (strain PAMC 26642) TaxID=1792307 RepID=UPI0007701D73|nr:type II toxin-antitoxin system RelE/ParE family toxin [Bosea sp. PAMC 26642]AMJ60825.1 hypothetical protein AXW83_11440 [Bosea sp. PAMC 26642]